MAGSLAESSSGLPASMGLPVTVRSPDTIQWLLVRKRGIAAHSTVAGT